MNETSIHSGHLGRQSQGDRRPGSARSAPVGLPRRLGCALYDALLLTAVLFFATALLLPFTGGRAVAPGNGWYSIYLLIWTLLYFLWPWSQAGQTLGMRAWRVVIVSDHGASITWGKGMLRASLALLSWAVLGLGFWWALTRQDRRTWHDLASGTHLERRA